MTIARCRKTVDNIEKELNGLGIQITQDQKDNMLNNRRLSQLTNTLFTLRVMRHTKIIGSRDELQDCFDAFIEHFNGTSNIVQLVPDDVTGDNNEFIARFRVKFNLNDKYVSDVYQGNDGIIYPSDDFYEDIERLGMSMIGHEINWNNTRCIGFFHVILEGLA